MTVAVSDAVGMLRERVRESASRGTPLRIVGSGTWLDAGRPTPATESLSTRELSGITEYVPGDLTLTARAGTALAEVKQATAAHNQWLALDPYGDDEGTIGATMATASSGPLATFFGVPRDLVLGAEFITGGGAVARGGGRVVKNVAGFDLTRLNCGAWGALGVITEITVRLHARPETDVTVAIALEPDGDAVAKVRQVLRRSPFKPYACEVLDAALANRLLNSETAVVLFRLGGNAEAVEAERAALAELGDAHEVGASVWDNLRSIEPSGAMVFRLSHLPSELARTWLEAGAISAQCTGAFVHASPARGVVRCIVPATLDNQDALRTFFAGKMTSTRTGERLPPALWQSFQPNSGEQALRARVKATFDPSNILNPGIVGNSE